MFRKNLQMLALSLLVITFFLNGIAAFHAYKLTHFSENIEFHNFSEEASIWTKLKYALFGVSCPKPQSSLEHFPSYYQEIILENETRNHCFYHANKNSKGVVLLCHGYGSEKSAFLEHAKIFESLGYTTFLIDFMGAGKTTGFNTTIGYKEGKQVEEAVDFLRKNGESNIILYGNSMGAVAILKAISDQKMKVNALILECPFGKMLKTTQNRFSMYGIPSFPFAHLLVFWGAVLNGFNAFKHNPIDYAKFVDCPTLLFHGEADPKVNIETIKTLFNNIPTEKKLCTFPRTGHENYLLSNKEKWTTEVDQFLNSHIK